MGKQGERRGRRYGQIKTGREPVSQGAGKMDQCANLAHEVVLQDSSQMPAIRLMARSVQRFKSPLFILFQQVV